MEFKRCMNEYQRQAYLTSMGVESYMPRWRLAVAPAPIACVVPMLPDTPKMEHQELPSHQALDDFSPKNVAPAVDQPVVVADMLRELKLEQPKRADAPALKPDAATPIPVSKPGTIPSFALSIWRPWDELLVIDSRNIRLALPTELLLQNILRALYGSQLQLENEEVLRWPLVDNTFVSRTIDDARSVLQVWLEVELERRPVKRLLLMGENAAQYFLKAGSSYSSSLFSLVDLQQFSTYALIAPSLVELLQRPELKRELWQALQPWRHVG